MAERNEERELSLELELSSPIDPQITKTLFPDGKKEPSSFPSLIVYLHHKNCSQTPEEGAKTEEGSVAYFRMRKVKDPRSESIQAISLRSVVTLPHARGKGYGRKMIEVSQSIASGFGIETIWVSSQDGKGEKGAQGFYQHLGFVISKVGGYELDSSSTSSVGKMINQFIMKDQQSESGGQSSSSKTVFLFKDLLP